MINTNSFGFFVFIWFGVFFICSIISALLFFKLLKLKNFGLALSLGYLITVVLAVIADYKIHADQSGWYLLGVTILGFPTVILSSPIGGILNKIFVSFGFYTSGTFSTGVGLIIGGGFQYYFIGYFIQKFLNNWKLKKGVMKL